MYSEMETEGTRRNVDWGESSLNSNRTEMGGGHWVHMEWRNTCGNRKLPTPAGHRPEIIGLIYFPSRFVLHNNTRSCDRASWCLIRTNTKVYPIHNPYRVPKMA